MRVVLIHRKPCEGAYSIEELFDTISGELKKRVEVIEYKTGSRWNIIRDVWRLRKLKADVYHVVGDVHYFVPLLPHNKTVLTIHDIIHYAQDLSGIKRWTYKWLWLIWPIRAAKAVTTISRETKSSIKICLGSYLGPLTENIEVIENCHSTFLKHVNRTFNSECPVILHLGTKPNKNLSRLIEALSSIKCQLVVIGQLDTQQKEQLAEQSISYINRFNLTYEEICQQYIDCDMVSFVSLAEGFGMPVIEAQASGRPLITSNLSPMCEIAGDGACLVDPLEVSQIREGAIKIIGDSVYRDEIVRKGLLNATRFSPVNICGRYLQLYKWKVIHDIQT